MRNQFFLKRGEGNLFFLFIIFIFLIPFIHGDTITELNVPNSPPYLIQDIPDQSWPENQSNLNAFDLDDYFNDTEGGPLSYYNSSVQDIYVYIDPVTNVVSFYPDAGFSGTRNVTFYASDSVYDTLSNVVMLYVGLDITPPQWNSPSIDRTVVYQNDIVHFSVNWTDDRGLDRFIFSINQGAGWQNYSSVGFSGTVNISNYSFQIMAPAFNTVYWKIYAFDTSNNLNVTEIQSFTVSSSQSPPGGEDEDEGTGGSVRRLLQRIDVLKIRKLEDFQLGVSEFKVSLKQGEYKTRVLKVTNTGLEELSISTSSEKITDFVIFSETNFSILPGKSKEITIDFNAPELTIPGQYFGYIKVDSGNVNKSVLVVLDIQAIELEFDISLELLEGYETVKPGKNVSVNITFSNLKDVRQIDAQLYYSIKDYTGKVYNFAEEDITFLSTLLLERELEVPQIAPEGNYLFYARASDEENIAIDSVAFEVGTRFNFFSFFKITSILILIFIFAILLAVFMVKYKRNKKKERLLELYLMMNKLKSLIKQKNEPEALKLFIKIKNIYHEPIPKEIFDDKERLKKEISELCGNFEKDSKQLTKGKLLPQGIPSPHKESTNPEMKKYIEYIEECRKRGFKDDFIKNSFIKKGWKEEEIKKVFDYTIKKTIKTPAKEKQENKKELKEDSAKKKEAQNEKK